MAMKKPRSRSAARKPAKSTTRKRPASKQKRPPSKRGSGVADGFITFREIRRAFGNLFVMADSPTTFTRKDDKFQQIKGFIDSNNKEVFYFLAAYVFDLHLRMVYVVEALDDIRGVDAKPAFAATVSDELREINGVATDPPKTWEQIAKDAFRVMSGAHNRIHAKRDRIVDQALKLLPG